jgi:hypothetical protein
MLRFGPFVHHKSRREGVQSMVLPVRPADPDTVRTAWPEVDFGTVEDSFTSIYADAVKRSQDAIRCHTETFISRYGMAPAWRVEFGPFEEVRDNGKPVPRTYSVTYTVDVGETLRRAAQIAVEGHQAEVLAQVREHA